MATDSRPAQPKSILRGHKAQVHAAVFARGNDRLLTGDADGFVVAWDLTILRPRAVWQAHANAILGIAPWGRDRLITHGRDNKLIVWKFAAEDEARLSTKLPLDPVPETRPQPWILHMLEVNTMNFCSFSHCPAFADPSVESSEILVAVPNTLASEAIDIFHLPSQTRQHTVKLGDKNGMVMAVSLFRQGVTLTLVAGYENGLATIAQLDDHGAWIVRYQAKCHSQPILSLDVSPRRDFFLTSSADAIIAKHPLPPPPQPSPSTSTPIPASPSTSTPTSTTTTLPTPGAPSRSLLTAALTNQSPAAPPPVQTHPHPPPIQTQPLKTLNTRHAGQQSLRLRSDARLFATAGWDGRVRVYSATTLAEVAVLKWHAVGCYAVAFADLDVSADMDEKEKEKGDGEGEGEGEAGEGLQGEGKGGSGSAGAVAVVVPKLVEMSVREKRVRQARTAHWLAAGSKDGKVSLWDVF